MVMKFDSKTIIISTIKVASANIKKFVVVEKV